ncbi:hypothetical protein [Thiosocius teredinicola]|uniref:hypothetical protein n=1 Tax=Thiosocius teredinicola TaxID=1973002 RepID=UPI000F76F944
MPTRNRGPITELACSEPKHTNSSNAQIHRLRIGLCGAACFESDKVVNPAAFNLVRQIPG